MFDSIIFLVGVGGVQLGGTVNFFWGGHEYCWWGEGYDFWGHLRALHTTAQGRGAIEIDVIETMPGTFKYDYHKYKVATNHCHPVPEKTLRRIMPGLPFVATSLQLAPGMPMWADERPDEWRAGDKDNCYPEDWSYQWYPPLEPGPHDGTTYGTAYNSTVNIDFWGEHFKNPMTGIDMQVGPRGGRPGPVLICDHPPAPPPPPPGFER